MARRFAATLLAFALLTAAAAPAAAQQQAKGGIKAATVNLAVLYALHPAVQYFNPEQGRFLNLDGKADPDFFRKRAEQNQGKIGELTRKIGELRQQLDRIEDKRREAQLAHYTDRRRVESDMESARNNPADKDKALDFSKEDAKLKAIDEAAAKQGKALDAEREKLHADAAKLNEELKAINYLVGPAHEKKVQSIVDEVTAIVNAVAARRGAGLVVNSAQFHRQVASRGRSPIEAFPSPYDPAQQAAPGSMYSQEQHLDKIVEAHGGLAGAKGALDYRIEEYARWMDEAPKYTDPFREANLHDLLLAGGEDITAECVAELLGKHGVEKGVIDLIMVGIKQRKIF